MNFKHETYEWGGHIFIRVSKKRFENFIRYFKDKIEGNSFMGWSDWYDWSLNDNKEITKDTPEEECWDNLEICNVARKYFETPEPEYWLRTDYCDLDSIPYVPKPREKRLTKKEKQLADILCMAFDAAFRAEAKSSILAANSGTVKIAKFETSGLDFYTPNPPKPETTLKFIMPKRKDDD